FAVIIVMYVPLVHLATLLHARLRLTSLFFFFFNDPATTEISTLSLHDALPICSDPAPARRNPRSRGDVSPGATAGSDTRAPVRRSEEHTSELQSLTNLVCRLLLEKKKKTSSLRRLHTREEERQDDALHVRSTWN